MCPEGTIRIVITNDTPKCYFSEMRKTKIETRRTVWMKVDVDTDPLRDTGRFREKDSRVCRIESICGTMP